jgi:hypothetical protein
MKEFLDSLAIGEKELKRIRSRKEATYPKCSDCGNTLGFTRQEEAKGICITCEYKRDAEALKERRDAIDIEKLFLEVHYIKKILQWQLTDAREYGREPLLQVTIEDRGVRQVVHADGDYADERIALPPEHYEILSR